MKRAQVTAQSGAEKFADARMVIAHARRAMSRGRAPSMPYMQQSAPFTYHTNPRAALRAALADMGYTMAELHDVPLEPVAVPIQVHTPWIRPVRRWLHKFKLLLNAARVPHGLPAQVTDHAVTRLLPRLMQMAAHMGLVMPLPRAAQPPHARWFDPTDPMPFARNELDLWPLHHYMGVSTT